MKCLYVLCICFGVLVFTEFVMIIVTHLTHPFTGPEVYAYLLLGCVNAIVITVAGIALVRRIEKIQNRPGTLTVARNPIYNSVFRTRSPRPVRPQRAHSVLSLQHHPQRLPLHRQPVEQECSF